MIPDTSFRTSGREEPEHKIESDLVARRIVSNSAKLKEITPPHVRQLSSSVWALAHNTIEPVDCLEPAVKTVRMGSNWQALMQVLDHLFERTCVSQGHRNRSDRPGVVWLTWPWSCARFQGSPNAKENFCRPRFAFHTDGNP
jgi:hypothetical protein